MSTTDPSHVGGQNTPPETAGDSPSSPSASAPAPQAGPAAVESRADQGSTPSAESPPVAHESAPADAASQDPAASSHGGGASDDDEEEDEGASGEAGGSEPTSADGLSGTAGGQGAKKRKRRRRRKDKAPGAPAEGEAGGSSTESAAGAENADGTPAEGDEEKSGDAASGEAKSEARAKGGAGNQKKPKGPPREKPPFGVGEEVVGRVTKVMPDAFMVDVSGKALGIFDRRELPESETPAEGEQIIGKVANDGSRGGLVVLTRDLNRWQKARTEVEAAFTHEQPVMGLITGVIKGGVEVDVDGLRGFAPASTVDLRLGADLHYLIGQRLSFRIVKFEKRGREFVLSRRAELEGEAQAAREKILEGIKPNEVVKGVVRSIQPFGVFVDVGGVDGLVHITEASHVQGPLTQTFKVGEEIEVKILRIDERGKIWLSRKALEKDPWAAAAEKYTRGSIHKGKVVRLQPFGAFIELETGIDGLMHVSDISPGKRIGHPSEVLQVGQEIEVIVAQANPEAHKIGLHPAPKEGERLPEGKQPSRLSLHQSVKVIVEAQEPTGLVVKIVGQTGRNAKGYVTAAATGTPKGTDLRKAFPTGKEFDAKIVELDPRKGIKLSIKALEQDQERQSFRQYQNEVKQASKFGTFGDLLMKKGITK